MDHILERDKLERECELFTLPKKWGLYPEIGIRCIFGYLEMLMICLLFLKSWNTKFQSGPNSWHASEGPGGKSDKSVSALEKWNSQATEPRSVPLVASQLLAAANKWSIRKALVESLSSARRRKRERMRKAEMPSKINFFRFWKKVTFLKSSF